MRLAVLPIAVVLAAGCAPAPLEIAMHAPAAAPVLDMGEGDGVLGLQLTEPAGERRLLASVFNVGQVTEIRVKVARTGGRPDGRFDGAKTLVMAYPRTSFSYPYVRGLAIEVDYTFSAEIWGLPNHAGVPQNHMNKLRPATATRRISQQRDEEGRAYPGSYGSFATLNLILYQPGAPPCRSAA